MMKLSKWIGVLLIGTMMLIALPQSTLALDKTAVQLPVSPYTSTPLHWSLGQLIRWFFSHRPPVVLGMIHEVNEEQLTVEIERPERHWGHSRGNRFKMVTVQINLDLNAETILFGGELEPLAVADLTPGEVVTVVPGMSWGQTFARLVFVGTPDDLAEYVHRGRLLSESESTLELISGRDDILTVNLSENTVWLDRGQVERPAERAEDVKLYVLGIGQDDGTVNAALVTTGDF